MPRFLREVAKPRVGSRRHRPLAVVSGRGGDYGAVPAEEDETDARRCLGEGQHGRDGSRVDLLAAGGGDELDARPAQGELACGGALLLAHEAHHAGDDQEEEQRRGHDEHEDVGIVERLVEADAGRDQARSGEQPEAERSETRARVERRLFERAHRGMERGRAPEQIESDPAHVVAQLVVVRVRQQGERVGGIHGEERDDAPDQEIEGRCPLAVVDRQAALRRRGAGCRRAGRRPTPPSRASSSRRDGCSERPGTPRREARCRRR